MTLKKSYLPTPSPSPVENINFKKGEIFMWKVFERWDKGNYSYAEDLSHLLGVGSKKKRNETREKTIYLFVNLLTFCHIKFSSYFWGFINILYCTLVNRMSRFFYFGKNLSFATYRKIKKKYIYIYIPS